MNECNAFQGSGLDKIVIPSTVKDPGQLYFAESRNLRITEFQDGNLCQRIGYMEFTGTLIEEIKIGRFMRSIESGAFSECPCLRSFESPVDNALQSFANRTFDHSSLENLTIPAFSELTNESLGSAVETLRITKFITGEQPSAKNKTVEIGDLVFASGRVFIQYPEGSLRENNHTMQSLTHEIE